jgi:hypothetical protein
LLLKRDEHRPRTQLRHPEIGGIQEFPKRLITLCTQIVVEVGAVVIENRIEQAANVFEHHRLRLTFPNEPYRCRKQIALVSTAQLLPSL